MSDPKPEKPPSLMELELSPPDGCPKLSKWDSTLKYRLKDQSLINVIENPFHIDSHSLDQEEEFKIIDLARRKPVDILPKCAPPPHVEESEKFPKLQSIMKPSERQERDQEIPISYKKISESTKLNESTDSICLTKSESSVSYHERYLEIKRTKALILKKIREDDLEYMKSSLTAKDPKLLDERDFMLDKNLIKTEYKSHHPSKMTEKNRTFEDGDLNSLTNKLKEYYI